MREEEEATIGQYVPVLRRIVILVAVLTAIPVVMWTITAFMRTYVGPPRLPTFQPVSAATATVPDGTSSGAKPVATVKLAKISPPPIVDANATGGATSDVAGNAAPAAITPDGAAAPASGPAPMAAAAPILGMPASANGDPAADQAPQVIQVQAPAAAWPGPQPTGANPAPAAATPAVAERIPLPRKRPRTVKLVQAQGPIPLPRPRPEAAGPVAPPPAATPLDFFRNIFQHNDHNDGASNPPPVEDAAVQPTNSASLDR